MNINDIIIKPIITEKSSNGLADNVYTLQVHKNADKTEIKRAVEVIFEKSGAKVKKVNIINVAQKAKRMGKYNGYSTSYKKAMISLSAGSIPIYGNEAVENTNPDAKAKKTINVINTEKLLKEAESK